MVLVASFYGVNGFSLLTDPVDGDEFVRTVGGDEHLELDALAGWLERHAVRHDVGR